MAVARGNWWDFHVFNHPPPMLFLSRCWCCWLPCQVKPVICWNAYHSVTLKIATSTGMSSIDKSANRSLWTVSIYAGQWQHAYLTKIANQIGPWPSLCGDSRRGYSPVISGYYSLSLLALPVPAVVLFLSFLLLLLVVVLFGLPSSLFPQLFCCAYD